MSEKNTTQTINTRGVFEEEILYGLLTNKQYFNDVVPSMQKEYFSEVGNSILFDKIQRYYTETGEKPNLKELIILLKDEPKSQRKVATDAIKKVTKSSLHINEQLLLDKTEDFVRKAIHTESLILGAEAMGENNDKKLAESYEIAKKANNFRLEDKEKSFSKNIISGLILISTNYPIANNVNTNFIPLQNGVLTMVSGRGGASKGISVLRSAIIYLEKHPEHTALL